MKNKSLHLFILAILLLSGPVMLAVPAQEVSADPHPIQALDEFMIVELSADDAQVIEHESVTGDDRGGIATSGSRVLVTGDNATGNYALANLDGGFSVGEVYDVLVSDLKTGQVYLLGHDGNPVPTQSGDQPVSELLLVDGETGALTGLTITLAPTFTLGTDYNSGALFAGYGRVVVYDGLNGALWSIATPSGVVSSLPFSALPYYYGCENWAMWGIAEYWGGEDYLVYRGNGEEIWRTRVSDGDTTVLAAFDDLSDMCSLSASLGHGRWYFHHEYDSQFGGSDETLGYARAAFSFPGGYLDGHVYDELTAAPIEGVTISAGWFQAETDAAGYYTLTLPTATYTVTAAHPLYQTESVAGVEIITDVVTTQDFDLLPRVTLEPSSVHVTLDWQTSATLSATIQNYMATPYDFEFAEVDRGFVPLAQQGSIALVSDDDELGAITSTLDDMGLTYDVWHEEDTNLYLADPSFLEGYGIVVWYTHDRTITLEEHDALEDWLQAGGRLLVTGYDSLGSPDDPLLADLVRSSQYGDDARGDTYEILLDHPITNGPYGVYPPGTLLPINNTDQDNAVADTARGAEAVATLVGEPYDKIIATEIDPGIVVYWNGNEYCDDWLVARSTADKPSEDKGEPLDQVAHPRSQDGQNLFKNTLDWFLSLGGVPWLGQEPISATVPASSTLDVTLLFTATYAAGVNQPGDYYAALVIKGDPKLDVPVQMTVLPPADLGRVGGYVLDRCTGDGVKATIVISGGVPITQTTSDPDTGRYAAWLEPGTYEFAFTAPGYLTHTATVDVTAGQTTTLDVDFCPDRPCMQVDTDWIEVWLLTGTVSYTHPAGINITNNGGQELAYEIMEISGTTIWESPMRPTPDNPGYDSADVAAIPVVPTAPTEPQAAGVLLIQDSNPWGYDSIETILTNNGIPYTIIGSAQIPSTDLAPYKMIIVPSVQGSAYNTIYNANLAKFEAFISWGGVMLLNYCEQSGDTPYRLPPFGGANNYQSEGWNYIVDPSHPIMAGVPNPYSGSSASHSYLTDLLPDDYILVTGGDVPGGNVVMIERHAGAGLLVASGQTYEVGYAYGWGNGIILDNMIPYYFAWASEGNVPWVWEEPVSGTVPADLLATGHVDVFFTAIVTDPLPLGTYTATLVVVGNDPLAVSHHVPTLMHIVDEFITPTAGFSATTPVCEGEEMWFYFTGDVGTPRADHYTWWFGDGVSMTVGTPDPVTHLYAPGTYTATLEVCNLQSGFCDTAEGEVEVNPLPVAGFSYAVDELTATFTDTSMYATSWRWEFGDGMTSTLQHPTHTYAMEGTYTVTQMVFNDCGSVMIMDWITVGAAPDAAFAHNAPVCLGAVVTFTNETTGTAPIWYTWDFSDGGTSTETNPVYLYTAAGLYTVTLDAQNAFGADQAMDWVEVLPLPLAAFTYTLNGLEVTFADLSENVAHYLWDFGDGVGTSTETNPVYTYADAGTYTVTLFVTSICGADTVAMPITVEEAGYCIYLPLVVKNATP